MYKIKTYETETIFFYTEAILAEIKLFRFGLNFPKFRQQVISATGQTGHGMYSLSF